MRKLWFILFVSFFILSCNSEKNKKGQRQEVLLDSIEKIITKNQYNNVPLMVENVKKLKNISSEKAKFLEKFYKTKSLLFRNINPKYIYTLDSLYNYAQNKPELKKYAFEIDRLIIQYHYSQNDFINGSKRIQNVLKYIYNPEFQKDKDHFFIRFAIYSKRINNDENLQNILSVLKTEKNEPWSEDKYFAYKSLVFHFIGNQDTIKAKKLINYIFMQNKNNNLDILTVDFNNSYIYQSTIPIDKFKVLNESFDIIYKTGHYNYLPTLYKIKGHLFIEKKDYQGALNAYVKSIERDSIAGNTLSMATSNIYAGLAFNKLYKRHQNLKNKYYENALNSNTRDNTLIQRIAYQRMLWNTDENTPIKEKISIQDSLIKAFLKNQTSSVFLSDVYINTQILLNNKDNKIEQLTKEAEINSEIQTKTKLYLLLFGILLTSLIIILNHYRKRNKFLTEISKKSIIIKEQNTKLNLLLSQLKESNKELENFANLVANDIKTPLNEINNHAEKLHQKINLNPENKEYSNYILQACQDLNAIINGILSFSTLNKNLPDPKIIDLNIFLERLLNNLAPKLKENNIQCKFNKNLPSIIAHESLIHQLYINILQNAIKFTKDKKNPKIEIGYDPTKKTYFVKDNGVGIPEDKLESIFEMFTQAHSKDKFKGHGLGLATSCKIIHFYKKKIWAESKQNKGATFFFTLPESNPIESNSHKLDTDIVS